MKVAADSYRCLYAKCLYLFEQALAQGIRGTEERLRAGDVDNAGKVTVTALIFHPWGEAAGTLQQGCSSRCLLGARAWQDQGGRKHLHFQPCHAQGYPQCSVPQH